jgi:hypothetical protein
LVAHSIFIAGADSPLLAGAVVSLALLFELLDVGEISRGYGDVNVNWTHIKVLFE